MIKRRGAFLVLLSVILGIATAWVANNWIQGRMMPAAQAENASVTVLAAAMQIPYGTKLEPRHVKPLQLPPGSVPEGVVREYDSIDGHVARVEILPGEILLAKRFVEHGAGSTLAALVEPNMRAVTVRVDDVVGVGGFLLPGNFVDVLATRMERKTRRAITETALRNIKVLAVDQTASIDKNEPVVVRAVTLEMTPKEAEELVKRKEEGTIQLTLRNPTDDAVFVEVKPEPKKAAPRPVYRPDNTTITVIKGTRVKQTKAKT